MGESDKPSEPDPLGGKMKNVLISIRPKWVKKIADGNKTIEVRKSRPKLSTPFKSYIYCTVDGFKGIFQSKKWLSHNGHVCNGKIVGEFICKCVTKYPWVEMEGKMCYFIPTEEAECTGLDYDDVVEYGAGGDVFFWNISDLKIYNKPLELSISTITKAPQDWCYVEELG